MNGSRSKLASPLFGAAIVVCATLAAYHNSLSGPLIFDDSAAITDNPSIRQLWPLGPVLFPPAECTVAGRPLANFAFALNYAFGGAAVRGYHAVNLAFHVLAALVLFGIVRRTIARLGVEGLSSAALALATASAAWWGVHPLLTGSVTYISQRTEVMMAFFYLLTLYAFIRAIEQPGRIWPAVSVLACVCAIASKEVAVTAPILIFVYDLAFVSDSLRATLRRWRYYAALGATWLVLFGLMRGLHQRAVGFGLGVTWWKYALTECRAICTYVRLVAWPQPLILDYGVVYLDGLLPRLFFGLVVGGGVIATLAGFLRWPRVFFPLFACWIFLAPTSSIVPVATQPVAENRVYLPAAAMITLGAVALYHWLGRRAWPAFAGLSVALLVLTVQRNAVYSSRVSIWADTAAKRPENPRPVESLGEALYELGRLDLARQCFERSVQLDPTYAVAQNNLGTVLRALGDRPGAIQHFEQAVRARPDYALAHNNYGNALTEIGRLPEARRELETALQIYGEADRLKPDLAETHNNMGNVLLYQGVMEEARHHYEEAVRLKPDFPQAQMNLGVALRQLGLLDHAVASLSEALRLRPAFPEAHFNLAVAFQQLGRTRDALEHYEAAVRLAPGFYQAERNLGDALVKLGRTEDAIRHYAEAIRLRPDDEATRANLERLRAGGGGLPKPDSRQ